MMFGLSSVSNDSVCFEGQKRSAQANQNQKPFRGALFPNNFMTAQNCALAFRDLALHRANYNCDYFGLRP